MCVAPPLPLYSLALIPRVLTSLIILATPTNSSIVPANEDARSVHENSLSFHELCVPSLHKAAFKKPIASSR